MKYNWRLDIKEIEKLYTEGYSCGQIGKMLGATRQAVWGKMRRAEVQIREKKTLPFYTYNGYKFTISKSTGYYRCTIPKTGRIQLHRYVWETERGKIPQGWDIHHLDCNKQNNIIDNLECLSKAEHTRKYSPHHNQYKNNKTKHLYEKKNTTPKTKQITKCALQGADTGHLATDSNSA